MAYVLAGWPRQQANGVDRDVRAKPAVYFGGKSRIIDFALSNALNSGIRRIGVATQYKAHSLIRHMQRAWYFFLQPERNESFDILPASQRVSEDPMVSRELRMRSYQNIGHHQMAIAPKYIVVLAGDHIYKMDYERDACQQHVQRRAPM